MAEFVRCNRLHYRTAKLKNPEDLRTLKLYKTNSHVEKSPNKIVIKDIAKGAMNPTILLSELNNRKPFNPASINAEVVNPLQYLLD